MGLATLACAAIAAASSPARAESAFSPETLIRALDDLYCTFPGQPPGACPAGTVGATQPLYPPEDELAALDPRPVPGSIPKESQKVWKYTTADQKIWALEIFDQIVLQDTENFNEIMSDLAFYYVKYPERRKAIELLLSMFDVQVSAGVKGAKDRSADTVRENLRGEFIERRRSRKIFKVADGALRFAVAAWTLRRAAGVVKGGRLFWLSRGAGLTRMERFKEALLLALSDAHRSRRSVWIVRGAAVGYGIVDMALDSFRTVKMDPRRALDPAREHIAEESAERAAAQRDELRAMEKASKEDLAKNAKTYQKRLEEIDQDATRIKNELGHLYEVAAELRPKLGPIAEDLVEIRKRIDSIQERLDLIDYLDDEEGDGGPKKALP